MNYYLAPQAEIDLEEIADYIARDNPHRAITFISEFSERFESLIVFPDQGRLRTDLEDGLRSLVHSKYLVFYRLENDAIRIERILHGSRDLSEQFDS